MTLSLFLGGLPTGFHQDVSLYVVLILTDAKIKQYLSKQPLKFRGLYPTCPFWGLCPQGVMSGVGKKNAGGFIHRGLCLYTG